MSHFTLPSGKHHQDVYEVLAETDAICPACSGSIGIGARAVNLEGVAYHVACAERRVASKKPLERRSDMPDITAK